MIDRLVEQIKATTTPFKMAIALIKTINTLDGRTPSEIFSTWVDLVNHFSVLSRMNQHLFHSIVSPGTEEARDLTKASLEGLSRRLRIPTSHLTDIYSGRARPLAKMEEGNRLIVESLIDVFNRSWRCYWWLEKRDQAYVVEFLIAAHNYYNKLAKKESYDGEYLKKVIDTLMKCGQWGLFRQNNKVYLIPQIFYLLNPTAQLQWSDWSRLTDGGSGLAKNDKKTIKNDIDLILATAGEALSVEISRTDLYDSEQENAAQTLLYLIAVVFFRNAL
jgi:hypothetical protein